MATTIGRSPVTASSAKRSRSSPGRTSAMIWTRQRQLNQLRSTLREFYPAALEAFDELGSRRRAGGAGDRADPDAGTGTVAVEDRRRAAARWPATTHR